MILANSTLIVLANEIVSSRRYNRDKKVLVDVLQYLDVILDKAIEGDDGEINTILLGQVITFYSIISPYMTERNCEFDIGVQLSKLVGKCYYKHKTNPHYSPSNVDSCITTISENAPPTNSLQVLSQLEHSCPVSSGTFVSAIHTSLIVGARERVSTELSGSLLRIQRARDEGRRQIAENGVTTSWNGGIAVSDVEDGGFIWSKVLDGMVAITK